MTVKTSICGYDADSITVRGRDLVSDLMGKLSFTEMMLFQALGREPGAREVRILDAVLVTIMEHGFVPSAVVTRLTHLGAPESFQGAVAAGLLGVGDRYAGTAGDCGALLERIVAASPGERLGRALAEVRKLRETRRPVPGFGHPIHGGGDPRVPRLLEIVREAGAGAGFLDALADLEQAVAEVVPRPLVTNISAAIGAALGEAGVPAPMMRGMVLTARCAGLVGHLFEELNQPAGQAIWDAVQDQVDYEP